MLMFLTLALSILSSFVVIWMVFTVALLVMKPEASTLGEAAHIVPETARLIHRLARDKNLHRGVRVRLWFLLGYLASPIDLIPDFIPVVGFADDVIITSLVLRSVIKRAGTEAVRTHWSGTSDGLVTLARLCRLPQLEPIDRSPLG